MAQSFYSQNMDFYLDTKSTHTTVRDLRLTDSHDSGARSTTFPKAVTMSKDSAAPALTKKEKGRLKKLRKRVQEVKQGCETSGLTSPSDWTEWQELQAALSPDDPLIAVGPSVRLRRAKKDEQWQTAEGTDHRDILWNMMAQQRLSTSTRKRKRNKDESLARRIPPWSTLHNPCTAQSMAVIELCLHDECTWDEMKEHIPVLSTLIDRQDKSKVALPVQTRWFQGNLPKSPTDILMYLSRSTSSNDEADEKPEVIKEGESSDDVLKNVVGRLQDLVLPRTQRKAEGFPIADAGPQRKVSRSGDDSTVTLSESRLLPIEEAKVIVQNNSVSVTNGEDQGVFVASMQTEHMNSPRVFALDCEMVKTAKGVELARVTLLQMTGVGKGADEEVSYKVVLEEFVKPYEPILDYVTRYSGVTAAIMNDVTTRLEQIQAAIMSIIDKNDIVVGHSLENDLRALRLVHDNVVDTAMVFQAKNGRKYCEYRQSWQFVSFDFLDGPCLLIANEFSFRSSTTSIRYSAWQKDSVQPRRKWSLQRGGRSSRAQSRSAPCTKGSIISNQRTWRRSFSSVGKFPKWSGGLCGAFGLDTTARDSFSKLCSCTNL